VVGDDDPFDAIPTRTLVTGAPILLRCTTWFDCEVMRRVDLEADKELYVGMIVSVLHNGEQLNINRVPEELD
jgi:flavin reductase (DIM6/NTAB) family NADH-FMN oxidoreductase RutF